MTTTFEMQADLRQLGFLLFVSALVAMFTRALRLPYTAGLVLAGIGLYFGHVRLGLHLSKDLIFSVFLPPLVFGAALYIRWSELKRDLAVIVTLATVGVLLSAVVTTVGMRYILSWEWGSSMLFGVLIAATDPVSVIATFNEAGAKGRLRLLVESESLLNDGTAAVAFVAVLAVLAGERLDALTLSAHLLLSIGGGVIIGAVVGYFFVFLASRTADRLVEITGGDRAAGPRGILGIRCVRGEFPDFPVDRRGRGAGAFQRSVGRGPRSHCPGDPGTGSGGLSGVCPVHEKPARRRPP